MSNSQHQTQYWKRFLGVDLFKVEWFLKKGLYAYLGVRLPKLKSQQTYWMRRGEVYRDEFLASGYAEREVYFQNMLVAKLRELEFDSFFEAGCGFGWNVARVKDEFPSARVGGVDFSETQLENAALHMGDREFDFVTGDICEMPLADDQYDIGFSLGVFMNIHQEKIRQACEQMLRVSKRYVIHLEYDETRTNQALREKRAFKTNIISHDYKAIYESLGKKIVELKTYEDFGNAFWAHAKDISVGLERWEGLEGPGKYVWMVVEV